MSPVKSVAEVFGAIQRAKTGGSAFCTNFFPVQSKLQSWIDHEELLGGTCEGAIFFLRKDRDFWHLYFCAANLTALQREISTLPALKKMPVVLDLIGQEATLSGLLQLFESSGFRKYARLTRLSRTANPLSPAEGEKSGVSGVSFASKTDLQEVFNLIESCFDRYADQLPTLSELQDAIAHQQVLVVRNNGILAALLFFETQGLTSTVRSW